MLQNRKVGRAGLFTVHLEAAGKCRALADAKHLVLDRLLQRGVVVADLYLQAGLCLGNVGDRPVRQDHSVDADAVGQLLAQQANSYLSDGRGIGSVDLVRRGGRGMGSGAGEVHLEAVASLR